MRTAVRLGYAAHELCDVVLSGAARPNSGDPSAVDADALPRQLHLASDDLRAVLLSDELPSDAVLSVEFHINYDLPADTPREARRSHFHERLAYLQERLRAHLELATPPQVVAGNAVRVTRTRAEMRAILIALAADPNAHYFGLAMYYDGSF